MEKITIAKDGLTPGEHLQLLGYESLGRLFDRYRKKYDCFEKDGITYEFRGSEDTSDTRVISLLDVSDKKLR